MNLKKHIIDTIKEWQLKIGYREGNMKLYYPRESLVELLGITEQELEYSLRSFCREMEPQFGSIKISGSYARYCLDIPAKGCAYVAGKVEEPVFLKLFLENLTKPGSNMEQIRECFAIYGKQTETSYIEEIIKDSDKQEQGHCHEGHAFYFGDADVEEYVYWVEENEFGLTYHRFTREEFQKMK